MINTFYIKTSNNRNKVRILLTYIQNYKINICMLFKKNKLYKKYDNKNYFSIKQKKINFN